MRITNESLRIAFLDALQQQQQRLSQTQTQIASGSKVNRPSDDPLAAANIAELGASLSRIEQHQTNAGTALNRLGLEEEALVGVVNTLQRIRELAVQSNNATNGPEALEAIGVELRQQLVNLVSLANSADGQGRYLFAGFSEETQPFVNVPAGVAYSGDDGQHNVKVSDNRLVATGDPGSAVFMSIRNGNGTFALTADSANTGTGVLGAGTVVDPAAWVADAYTIAFTTATDFEVRDSGGGLVTSGTYSAPQVISFLGVQVDIDGAPMAGDQFFVTPSVNQSVFASVQRLVTAVEGPASSSPNRAFLHNEVGQTLGDLDQAVGHLLDVRAEVGARLRAVESETSLNDGFSLQLTETLSNIRDVDYAEVVSNLTHQLFNLEATQQSYTRLQGLSLFRFL